MKKMLPFLLLLSCTVQAQYIGVKARYTETRLMSDDPNPPRRENHLVLSFFEVAFDGTVTPTSLFNFDLYIQKQGFQYGSLVGGTLDSAGNNYPGYEWPAPKAVAYYNSMGRDWLDCSIYGLDHFVVNGHELDCGFIPVSYWDVDVVTGLPVECFPAPNIALPYYEWPHPYAVLPGNYNFQWPFPPTAPYNNYTFICGGVQQMAMRGILQPDTGGSVTVLPVRFSDVRVSRRNDSVVVSFSNLTESDVQDYQVERSVDALRYEAIGTLYPSHNNGAEAKYNFSVLQNEMEAFYRIKATEISGKIYYSNIIAFRRDANPITQSSQPDELNIYPNPVTGTGFTFKLKNAQRGRYIAAMTTPDGRETQQKLVMHSGGDLSGTFDLASWPAGIYRLILRGEHRKYTQNILYVR